MIKKKLYYNIFDIANLTGYLKNHKIKTTTNLKFTTRKEDIKFEKELNLKGLKESVKLWDYMSNFLFKVENVILFNSKFFLVFPRKFYFDSNFLLADFNESIFYNKIFEIYSFIYLVFFNYIFLIDYIFNLNLILSHIFTCIDKLEFNFKSIIYFENLFYLKYKLYRENPRYKQSKEQEDLDELLDVNTEDSFYEDLDEEYI